MREASWLAGCAALFLSGCNQQPTGQYAEAWQLDTMQTRLTALEQDVGRLQPLAKPPLKLGDGGFDFIEAGTGGATVQWVGSADNGNGVQLRFRFGNPSTASWNRYSLIGTYGKLTEDGEPDYNTSKPFMIESDQVIAASSWKTVVVQLDGPKSQDVGFVSLSSILVANIGLAAE